MFWKASFSFTVEGISRVENEGGAQTQAQEGQVVAGCLSLLSGVGSCAAPRVWGLVGRKVGAAKPAEPRVETDVGCKATFLKAV